MNGLVSKMDERVKTLHRQALELAEHCRRKLRYCDGTGDVDSDVEQLRYAIEALHQAESRVAVWDEIAGAKALWFTGTGLACADSLRRKGARDLERLNPGADRPAMWRAFYRGQAYLAVARELEEAVDQVSEEAGGLEQW